MPCALAAARGPLEVLADARRRVVGREHQADDLADTPVGELLDRRLDLGVGVLQPERHVERARVRRLVERDAASAARCASVRCGERRDAADARRSGATRSASCSGVGGRPRRMSV